jgi:hypothetical protein
MIMNVHVHVYVYMGLGAWSWYILACFILCLKYVCKYVLICVNLYISFSKFVYVCDWYVIIFVKDYLHPKVHFLCLTMFMLQLLSDMMQFINTLKSTKNSIILSKCLLMWMNIYFQCFYWCTWICVVNVCVYVCFNVPNISDSTYKHFCFQSLSLLTSTND